jgi:hypothetical protein
MKDLTLDRKMEKIFSFVNFNTKTKDGDQFLTLAMKYLNFVYPTKEINKRYISMSSLFIDSEGNQLDELPKLLVKLQARLIKILESIIGSQKKFAPIKLKGIRTISFKNQQMVETFENENIQTKKISFGAEKKMMEASFIDMISNDEIVLKYFKRCQNDRCKKFIYEPKKLYCDDRCGNAYRQRGKKK